MEGLQVVDGLDVGLAATGDCGTAGVDEAGGGDESRNVEGEFTSWGRDPTDECGRGGREWRSPRLPCFGAAGGYVANLTLSWVSNPFTTILANTR